MATKTYLNVPGITKTTNPPLTEVFVGREADMVKNHSGSYVFNVGDFAQTERFIMLGSQGGSYYCSEKVLTKENADAVIRAIQQDGIKVVKMVEEISNSGKAPKNDPAFFVLALCLTYGNNETKAAVKFALPRVARYGTALFHFVLFCESMRGHGRSFNSALKYWYDSKNPESLAKDVVKYVQRDGWSHKDILRLAKPKTLDPTRNSIYHYVTKGWESVGEAVHSNQSLIPIWAAERAKLATTEKEIVNLIQQYNIPMEVIPTHLRGKAVYEALIPGAGMTWLLRNLSNLSKSGAIATGQYSNLSTVVARLTDKEQIKAGRIHPLAILMALNTYKSGKSVKGDGTWPVIDAIVDALDEAFYLSFDEIVPSGARFVLGCDVSPSMRIGEIAGMTGIVPSIATGVMAMATKRVEKNSVSMAFTSQLVPLNLTKTMRLDAVIREMESASRHWGDTDISRPITWATKEKIEADAFVILTDNDTNSGVHPVTALKDYQQKMGIDAKLIVVAMTPTNFSVADPKNPRMLDIHGFSSDAPAVISSFAGQGL